MSNTLEIVIGSSKSARLISDIKILLTRSITPSDLQGLYVLSGEMGCAKHALLRGLVSTKGSF